MSFYVSIFGGFEHLRNFKAPVARRCWAEVGVVVSRSPGADYTKSAIWASTQTRTGCPRKGIEEP